MRWCEHWIFSLCLIILIFVSQDASLFAKTINFGRYHALLIANQNYKHWDLLHTPRNDVNKLAAILKAKYGFDDVKILPDATRNQIIDRLEDYRVRLTNHDNLLIYYAGHGILRKDGGYWIGVDGQKNSRSRWLHYSTISDLIDSDNGMKAKHVLVIADSCYAGAITRDEDVLSRKQSGESDQAWFLRMQTKRSRRALTSGGTEPVIDRAGAATHSIFAQELIRRLESNSNILETSSLFDLIKKDVHARALRIVGNDAQAPEYAPIPGTGDGGGGFLFVLRGSVISDPESPEAGSRDFGIKGDTIVDHSKTNSLGMKFVFIQPGTFTMGSPDDEPGRDDWERQHHVTLTQGFYMQTTEVTQGQWLAVMGSNPSSNKACGDDCPVESVSWHDVQEFIDKLNAKSGSFTYRLPTEAEWEYAARAGTQTPFIFGHCLSTDQANFNGQKAYDGCAEGTYREEIIKVGSFQPNSWGLFDIHGNVWEWCQDWYGEYPDSKSLTDPKGPSGGSERVYRGGGCFDLSVYCRSAFRGADAPSLREDNLGFRLICFPGQ